MTLTGAKHTPTPRLGGTVDPVVNIIKSKVLQEFIPQVPDIVTYIEKQYGYDSETARNYLQNRVGNVLIALSTPLLDEQRKLQRKVDTQDAELAFAKDVYTRSTAAAKAIRNDLHECERKSVAAVEEAASMKAQNSKHSDNLMALLRAFGVPTKSGNLSNAWAKLNRSVDALLRQRQKHETTKQQLELLQEKLKEKTDRLNAAVEGEQKQSAERIARLSEQLVATRKELETYKAKAEYEIATLKQSVDQKNEQIEAFKTIEANGQARIEQLTTNDVSKQSHIDRLTESVVEKQSVIDRLIAARENNVSLLGTATNECSATVGRYTARIDSLNRQIDALSVELRESKQNNDRTETCLAEFSVIKSLYDRVSESLQTARAYYQGTVNYNEPVTNIILDVLAKVQENATDFSGVKIPKPTPIVAPDIDDDETVASPKPERTKRRSQRLRIKDKASKSVSKTTTRSGNKTVDALKAACVNRNDTQPIASETQTLVAIESDPDRISKIGGKRRRRSKSTPYDQFGKTKSFNKNVLSKQTPYEFGKIRSFDKGSFAASLFNSTDDKANYCFEQATPPSRNGATSNSDGNNVDAPLQSSDIEIAASNFENPLSPMDPNIPQDLRDMFTGSDQESVCDYTVIKGNMPMLTDTDFDYLLEKL